MDWRRVAETMSVVVLGLVAAKCRGLCGDGCAFTDLTARADNNPFRCIPEKLDLVGEGLELQDFLREDRRVEEFID
jgi:hypothetical protein